MIYSVRFYQYTLASQPIYLEGPIVDLVGIWNQFKDHVSLAPEPNVFSFGEHKEWLLAKAKRLLEFQTLFDCKGDFDEIFIQFLIKGHRFKLVEVVQAQL